MDLSIYDVIKGPVVTDKAFKMNKKERKLAIEVHVAANKPLIKEALEKLFSVKVATIRIIVRKGKTRFVKRREVVGATRKRAIVTLKEGYSVNAFEQSVEGIHAPESTSNAA